MTRRWGFRTWLGVGLLAAVDLYVVGAVVHHETWERQDFGERTRALVSAESGRDLSGAATVVEVGSPPSRFVCVTDVAGGRTRTYVVIYYRRTIETAVNEINTPAHPSMYGIDEDVSFMCRPIDMGQAMQQMRDDMARQDLPEGQNARR